MMERHGKLRGKDGVSRDEERARRQAQELEVNRILDLMRTEVKLKSKGQ